MADHDSDQSGGHGEAVEHVNEFSRLIPASSGCPHTSPSTHPSNKYIPLPRELWWTAVPFLLGQVDN